MALDVTLNSARTTSFLCKRFHAGSSPGQMLFIAVRPPFNWNAISIPRTNAQMSQAAYLRTVSLVTEEGFTVTRPRGGRSLALGHWGRLCGTQVLEGPCRAVPPHEILEALKRKGPLGGTWRQAPSLKILNLPDE